MLDAAILILFSISCIAFGFYKRAQCVNREKRIEYLETIIE